MSFLEIENNEAVATVWLNRPELHNAFNAAMIAELHEAFRRFSADSELRAVVLRGRGKSFCAGADLEWMKSMKDYSLEENRTDSLALFDMFAAIRNCSVPVLALAQGNVFGGGLGLLAASDIVFAESSTKFCFSEVKLGLVPAVISPFVSEKCQPAQVRQWMLTAKLFDAEEALHGGLLAGHASAAEIEILLKAQLKSLSHAGREGVRETKKLLLKLPELKLSERREETARVIAERRVSVEGQEGLQAFLEKRRPSW